MAPTIRIVSLRVGRRKGRPIPDHPTRRDPIPCSARTLRMQRAVPPRSFIPYRTAPPRANGELKRPPFPHDVHRGGSAPCSAGEKQISGGSSPPRHRCIPARPPSPDRKEIDTPSVPIRDRNGCGASGRTATKKRTAVVPAALRALSVSAENPCESTFTISTAVCVRSRRG